MESGGGSELDELKPLSPKGELRLKRLYFFEVFLKMKDLGLKIMLYIKS